MKPAPSYTIISTQLRKAAQQVAQKAIQLKVTTTAICGAVQKRWSIEWQG